MWIEVWLKNILTFLFLFLLPKKYIEIYLLMAISKYILQFYR